MARAAGALGVAAALAVGALTTAGPAAAAGCNGGSCTGQDPVAEGCSNDATTIDHVSAGSFVVNLRYSAACYAVWAQAVGTADSDWAGDIQGYTSQSAPGPVVTHMTGTPTPSGSYGLMISDHYWVKACVLYNASGWETQQCTAFH